MLAWTGYSMFVNGDLKGKFIMDRNLGARDTKFADDGRGILYYSYGRKDPFPGYSTNSSNLTTSYIGRGSSVWAIGSADNETVPISTSVGSPMSWYVFTSGNWCSGVDSESILWNDFEQDVDGGGKSIFDPSPHGWKIPTLGAWSGLGSYNSYWESESDIGCHYPASDPFAFFPAHGRRTGVTPNTSVYEVEGIYWHSTPSSTTNSYRILFRANGISISTLRRTDSYPLRPVQHYE